MSKRAIIAKIESDVFVLEEQIALLVEENKNLLNLGEGKKYQEQCLTISNLAIEKNALSRQRERLLAGGTV